MNKRSIKYLRKAKADGAGKASGGCPGPHGGGRKRPRIAAGDKLDVEQVESFTSAQVTVDKQSATKRHQQELDQLKSTDPEFFEFLSQNDGGLLQFEGSDAEDESDMSADEMGDASSDDDQSESDEDDENAVNISRKGRKARSRISAVVTDASIASAAEKAAKGSLPALRKLLSMFRCACFPDAAAAALDDSEAPGLGAAFNITSPDLYEKVIVATLESAHSAFAFHFGMTAKQLNQRAELEKLVQHEKWKKMRVFILSFFKSVVHTLEGLAESAQRSHMAVSVYLTNALEPYVPFLTPLPRMARAVIKMLLNLWARTSAYVSDAERESKPTSSSSSLSASGKKGFKQKDTRTASTDSAGSSSGGSEEGELNARAHAFLRIRQIARTLPGAIAEECFRSIYLKFARECKSYNELSAGSVNFMAQCVAELYASDVMIAYQQAFLYVRQLALHLRAAFLKKNQENVRKISNWQFVNCVRVWTKVLCRAPGSSDGLGVLVFPLCQIIVGVISACTSVYSTPLKLHLLSCLQQLAAGCETFIPTAARLLEILEHQDLAGKPTPATEAPPKLQFMVKLPTNSLAKVVVRDCIVNEVITLLRREAEIYRFHVAFPEYFYLPMRRLKAYAKKIKVAKTRDLVKALCGQLEFYAEHAKEGRKRLGKGPMEITEFEPLINLLPAAGAASSLNGAKKSSKVAQQQQEGAHSAPAMQRLVALIARSHVDVSEDVFSVNRAILSRVQDTAASRELLSQARAASARKKKSPAGSRSKGEGSDSGSDSGRDSDSESESESGDDSRRVRGKARGRRGDDEEEEEEEDEEEEEEDEGSDEGSVQVLDWDEKESNKSAKKQRTAPCAAAGAAASAGKGKVRGKEGSKAKLEELEDEVDEMDWGDSD